MTVEKNKVVYLCLVNPQTGHKFYYRQEYLTSLCIWGAKRPITKTTFEKRKKDGYPVEYRPIKEVPHSILCKLQDLDDLIDFALQIRDRDWFHDLVNRKKKLLNG